MSKNHILIVEDDRDTKKLISLLLTDKYNISAVRDYIGAMRIVKEATIDLILLDLALKGKRDGLELVRTLRESPQLREIPVIAVTAHALHSDWVKASQAGCYDFIPRPFTRDVLTEKFEQYLN